MKLSRQMIGLPILAIAAGVLFLLWLDHRGSEPWNIRKTHLQTAAEEAQLVIDAIDRYVRFKGRTPESLDALIPDHIRWIPEPGIPGCGSFKYLNFGSGKISTLWYDLGPRSDSPSPQVGPSIDGDPRHAILLITLSPDDFIIDARFERMPKDAGKLEFDPQQWKKGSNRMGMALQLPDYANLRKMPRSTLVTLLGPPDGSRVLRDTPWELRIVCPKGLAERELFIYWPTGVYPDQIYGGTTRPVGSWVYIPK